jgi:hypothetical protein
MDGQLCVKGEARSIPAPEKQSLPACLLSKKEKDACIALAHTTARERESREQSLTPLCKASSATLPSIKRQTSLPLSLSLSSHFKHILLHPSP